MIPHQYYSAFVFLILTISLSAQNYQPTPNDTLTSVRIFQNGQIKFQIYAPDAKNVLLAGPDIPNIMSIGKMEKQENGVWEVTLDSLSSGAYRYNFIVDGIFVLDSKNPKTSESKMNTWSLFYVPGSDFMDEKNVPHGAIDEVNYYSKSLKKYRRMQIYTPPGYNKNDKSYPVFYLLHGASDSDDSWKTVGRAGFIIDNLIAEGKAVPMIIVMPAGHTKPFYWGMPRTDKKDEFIEDFITDIKPYVETNYRTLNGRKDRAIAGLSMGGGQTINIAFPNLEDYSYIGVFSSGIFGITGGESFMPNMGTSWEKNNISNLDNLDLKKDLKLVWFSTGKNDFLLNTTKATVDLLKKHNFDVVFKESEGGHTWINWREYLLEFSQYLFK